jgi:hypothetical protein
MTADAKPNLCRECGELVTRPAPRGYEQLYCTGCDQRLRLRLAELTEAERLHFRASFERHVESATLWTNAQLMVRR